MAEAVEVTITESDPRFFEALADPAGFFPHLRDAMQRIVTAFSERASEYAPESEANQPGRTDKEGRPMGYYERGRGWWYPVMTHNALGLGSELPIVGPHPKGPKTMGALALLARGFSGVAGYKLRPTSEQMHDRWTAEVQQSENEVAGRVANTASYSSYVQGPDQTALHASRDWQTVEQTWESDDMQNVVEQETLQAIDDYYNLGA